EGDNLDAFTEITIKDDERNDPPISKEALVQLNILTEEEYEKLIKLTKQISRIIQDELAANHLDLYDIKLEFGRDKASESIMLIDEISGGNMRVYKGSEYIEPIKLEKLLFE